MRKLLIALCLVASMAWGGMEFDGVDDYVIVPHNSKLNATPYGLSISSWFLTGSDISINGILEKGLLNQSNGDYGLLLSGGKLYFGVNGYAGSVVSDAALSTNKLYFAVGTYDGVNVKLYLDGVPIKTNSYSTALSQNSYPLIIAAYNRSSWSFDGKIYNTAIWDRALSASDVDQLYKSGVKQYPIDTTTMIDSSGNGINGYATRGAVFAQDTNGWYADVNAKAMSVYTNDSKGLLHPTNAITISAWLMADAVGGIRGVFDATTSGGANGAMLLLIGQMRFYIDEDGASDWKYAAENTAMATNVLYHYVATWDGTTVKLYKNAVLQTTTASANKITYVSAPKIVSIGNYGDSYPFDGKIYKTTFWNRALSDTEVTNLYTAGISGTSATGAVAEWRMNPSSIIASPTAEWYGSIGYSDGATYPDGTPIYDVSGNGLHGYATNGVKQVSVQVSTNAAGFTTPIPIQKIKRRK